jgi:hypothetical protein
VLCVAHPRSSSLCRTCNSPGSVPPSSVVVVLTALARDRGRGRRVRQHYVVDSTVIVVVCLAVCSPSVVGCTSESRLEGG